MRIIVKAIFVLLILFIGTFIKQVLKITGYPPVLELIVMVATVSSIFAVIRYKKKNIKNINFKIDKSIYLDRNK